MRKIPIELADRIKFYETLARAALITLNSLEPRLEELDRDRAALDATEAQLRKDAEGAPERLRHAQAKLSGLLVLRGSILSGPAGADPAKRRERIEAKIARRHKLIAQLEALENGS